MPRQGSSSYGGEEHLFSFLWYEFGKGKSSFRSYVAKAVAATNAQVTLRQNLNSLLFCDHDKDKNKTKKQQ